jgi:hypothetical protein
MPAPLPPLVVGPIYPLSPHIGVENVLPDATVEVYENGVRIAAATSTSPGTVWVTLANQLVAGRTITATQTHGASPTHIPGVDRFVSSAHSIVPVPVLPYPHPLPSPVFASWLTEGSDAVLFTGLLPGATVNVLRGGHLLFVGLAEQTTQWFSFPDGLQLAHGDVLEATLDGPELAGSATMHSLPAGPAIALSPARTSGTLRTCQRSADFTRTTPGASVVITQGDRKTHAHSAFTSVSLTGLAPLAEGHLTVRESFPRNPGVGASVLHVDVKHHRPPLPKVRYTPCHDVRQLTVTGLVPGSILTLTHLTPELTPAVVGVQGVSSATSTVNLPPSFELPGAFEIPAIGVEVTLCGEGSSAPGHTEVVFPPFDVGEPTLPFIRPVLFACARAVQLLGAHPGSRVQVFSEPSGLPRSAAVVIDEKDPVIPLWSPLVADETIVVKVSGCKAVPPPPMPVAPLPAHLPRPEVRGPIFSGAARLTITGALQGAQVLLFVNDLVRAHVDTNHLSSFDEPISVPVGTPALAAGDRIKVRQTLCTLISADVTEHEQQVVHDEEAPPPGGAHSNHNYVFFSPNTSRDGGCANLTGATIVIDVTHAIRTDDAYSLQFNAFGPKHAKSGAQQYSWEVDGGDVGGSIDTWPLHPKVSPADDFIAVEFDVVSLSGSEVPAGARLTLALVENDAAAVTGAHFTVEAHGHTTSVREDLLDLGEDRIDRSPIIAFELNAVGDYNGDHAHLAAGAGTITYSADQLLTPRATLPSCAETLVQTEETANTVYEDLPTTPGHHIHQTFEVRT